VNECIGSGTKLKWGGVGSEAFPLIIWKNDFLKILNQKVTDLHNVSKCKI
jgi:hypothetical protein